MGKTQAILVPPYDDDDIICGQGTIGFEILEQCHRLGVRPSVVAVPCGGGGFNSRLCYVYKANLSSM